MKKYILKQDLPLAKAGTIVQVDLEKDFPKIYENKERNFKLIGVVDRDIMDKWLEEVPEKPKSVWNLKQGDDFYFIFNNSVRQNSITNYEPFIIYHLAEGNVFLTKEEAEKELNKRKEIQRVKKYCWENNIELSQKYKYMEYQYSFEYTRIEDFDGGYTDGFDVDNYGNNGNCIGYFKSIDDAKKVIEKCERELLVIFNV